MKENIVIRDAGRKMRAYRFNRCQSIVWKDLVQTSVSTLREKKPKIPCNLLQPGYAHPYVRGRGRAAKAIRGEGATNKRKKGTNVMFGFSLPSC